MPSLRLSLLSVASVCLLLSACAGGSSETGAAGSSGGGTAGATGAAGTGSGTAGAGGQSGTTGSGGTTGNAGAGGGIAGNGAAGTGGATGSAGQSGSAGTTGSAGRGGTAGATGVAGQGGSTGAAGSAGRGGTGGQAGSAGGGGRGGTTGSAGTGGATATGFFSDGFESGTVGMQPPGWMNFIAYVANNSMNPSGTTMAVVDSTRAHSGTKSVKVHGGSSPAQLTRALPTGTNKLYVRAWIYLTRQLGLNTGTNHDTLIGIRRNPNGADDEVRFGEVLGAQGKGALGTNVVPSDDFSPRLATVTTATVAPNRWACFEVAFLADQPQHTLSAWVDGTMVHSVTSPTAWEHGNEQATWLTGRFVQVIMGWQSFSGVDTDLWIDDVVLSTSPIGCN
jgi:hypothetical protein